MSSEFFSRQREDSQKLDETFASPQSGSFEAHSVASEKTNRVSVLEDVVYDSLPDPRATLRDDQSKSDYKSTLSSGLAFFFAQNPTQHAKLLRMLNFEFDPNVVGSNGDPLLHYVIRIGQFDLIPELVRHGARLDTLNREGQTPFELYRAIGGNQEQVLALLQPEGKKEDTQGAHEKNQVESNLEISLPKNEEKHSWVSIEQRVREGNVTEIEHLLDRGLDPNTRLRSGRSLLGLAVEEGKDDIVDLLLQHGANPLRKDVTGKTPVRLAQTVGRIDLSYKLLCATKGQPESSDNSPYETSSRMTVEEPAKPTVWRSTAKIKMTAPSVPVGPEVQAHDEPQVVPERKATRVVSARPDALKETELVSVHPDVVKEAELVVDRPVEDKEPEPKAAVPSGDSATSATTNTIGNSRRLSEASFYIRKSRTNDLVHLLEAGLDPNASLANGHSLLHAAVETYCVPIINLLLVHGADPKRTDASGLTAIKAAQNLGRADLAYKLFNAKPGQALEKHAPPAKVRPTTVSPSTSNESKAGTAKPKLTRTQAEWNRRIAIHETDYYIRQGRPQDVERWLKEGLDPNTCLDSGKSLLRRATELNQREVIDVLLRYGADPRRKDERGFSAIDVARLTKNVVMLSVLERRPGPSASISERSTEEASRPAEEKKLEPTENVESVPSIERPMQLVEKYVRENQIVQLKEWLDKGFDSNVCTAEGRSLLRLALENDAVDVAALLLSYGADPMFVDQTGVSPMRMARVLWRTQFVKLFERDESQEKEVRNVEAEDDETVESPVEPDIGEQKAPELAVEPQKVRSVEEKKDEPLFVAPIEDDFEDSEEDEMVPFDRPERRWSWKPQVAQSVPYTANDGGIFTAIDESDNESEDDFVSGLGDVNVTVKRKLVGDDTESAVGLRWKDCVIATEDVEDALEGISLLPVPINEKNRFRRWCTGDRPDVKDFLEHAEMMHMLALYAESYLNRR